MRLKYKYECFLRKREHSFWQLEPVYFPVSKIPLWAKHIFLLLCLTVLELGEKQLAICSRKSSLAYQDQQFVNNVCSRPGTLLCPKIQSCYVINSSVLSSSSPGKTHLIINHSALTLKPSKYPPQLPLSAALPRLYVLLYWNKSNQLGSFFFLLFLRPHLGMWKFPG